jgi:hypothetical protein
MLTKEQIQYLLELLAQEIVVTPTKEFPYTVTRRAMGYSADQKRGELQAKLSLMRDVVSR